MRQPVYSSPCTTPPVTGTSPAASPGSARTAPERVFLPQRLRHPERPGVGPQHRRCILCHSEPAGDLRAQRHSPPGPRPQAQNPNDACRGGELVATYRLNPVDWVFVSRDIPYSNDRTSQTVSLMTTGYAPGYLILRI